MPSLGAAAAAVAVIAAAYVMLKDRPHPAVKKLENAARRTFAKIRESPAWSPYKPNYVLAGGVPADTEGRYHALDESASSIIPDEAGVDAIMRGDISERGNPDIYAGDIEPPHQDMSPDQTKSCRAVPEYDANAIPRLYTTAEVDPIVTGKLYRETGEIRQVYAGRTALGDKWGLHEYAPDNIKGMTGVDVGPNALAEYEGSALGYNDGIPAQWAFPSTPIRRYRPKNADYYGVAGPTVQHGDALYPLYVPDHEPYLGMEEGPDVYGASADNTEYGFQ